MRSHNSQSHPPPFLGPLFYSDVKPTIVTGWEYSPAEIEMHGVTQHRAIDFAVPRGTPVLAAADGWYVCTYSEVAMKDSEGNPKLLSLSQAKLLNTTNPELNPPEPGNGPWQVYYGSYVIQGWHGHGRYTQYAHIDFASENIPYYPSVRSEHSANLYHHPILKSPVKEYKRPGVATYIKRGEVIGWVGSTGCGWGRMSIEDATVHSDGRPDFRLANYPYYDGPHLHFMVFGQRNPKTRKASQIWDPFGIYSRPGTSYPTSIANWGQLPHSLWLPM